MNYEDMNNGDARELWDLAIEQEHEPVYFDNEEIIVEAEEIAWLASRSKWQRTKEIFSTVLIIGGSAMAGIPSPRTLGQKSFPRR